jgi:Integrase core domain
LYWIAQEYLRLPSELAPQVDQAEPEAQLPSWYVDLRAYWQQRNRQPVTLGDLFDLRHGLRHAIPVGPARADLPGWLTLMTRLAEQTPDVEARPHAVYEIVAARSQGTADLRPAEPLIRRFMADVQRSEDPTLLFNASLLIQFCTAAAGFGHTYAICERMIGTLRRELLDRILIVNERHLRRILAVSLQHFNTARPHRTLGQLAPAQAET